MSLHSRLRNLERLLATDNAAAREREQFIEDCHRHFTDMLVHVPKHLREAVVGAYANDPDVHHTISELFLFLF